jgi:hypothetical protein
MKLCLVSTYLHAVWQGPEYLLSYPIVTLDLYTRARFLLISTVRPS